MRKRLLLVAAMLTAALTVYATASTAAAPTWKVEHYATTETWHAFADIGKKDNGGPADIYVARQALEAPGGASVGEINGYGVNLHPPYVFFHWTASLPGGSLTVAAAVDVSRKKAAYPIEGGTGRYSGARGTVTVADTARHGTLVTVRYTVDQASAGSSR